MRKITKSFFFDILITDGFLKMIAILLDLRSQELVMIFLNPKIPKKESSRGYPR